uniref:Putative secreted protein n=1 Tax=Ixodes ricinus TaxID=34613 RepID=A0A6B0UFM9_IXORI
MHVTAAAITVLLGVTGERAALIGTARSCCGGQPARPLLPDRERSKRAAPSGNSSSPLGLASRTRWVGSSVAFTVRQPVKLPPPGRLMCTRMWSVWP